MWTLRIHDVHAVKYFEHIPVKESHDEQNDAPDLLYILYKYVIVFNHFKNELTLVEMLSEGEESGLPELEAAIENRNYASYNFSVTGPVTSPITDEEHKANVRKGIAHCMRGDVFQIVLSRRFIQPYAGDDFKVYRALRSINPSPYLFYFDFGGYRIFGFFTGNTLQNRRWSCLHRSDCRNYPPYRRCSKRPGTDRSFIG